MKRVARLCAGVVCALAAGGARAEEPLSCFDRDAIVAHLALTYGETQQRVDLAVGSGYVEFFANLASGSWTILLTTDATTSCVVETGYLPGTRGSGDRDMA